MGNSCDKACLFNIIVYATNPHKLKGLQDMIDGFVQKYPARVITILTQEDALLHIDEQEQERGYSQVHITLPANQQFMELYLLPFLIPDYPIYLVFGANPEKNHQVFKSLSHLSDRLLVDAETTDNLEMFSRQIGAQIDGGHLTVCDINWAKISGWRNILSEIFNTSIKLDQLRSCKLIQMVYQVPVPDEMVPLASQALYLQAWLASKLGWDFEKIEVFHTQIEILYTFNNHEIKVHLAPKNQENFVRGAITHLEITTVNSQMFHIIRQEDSPQVKVQISTFDTCDLPFTLYLPNVHKSSSYFSQLLYSGADLEYREMLSRLNHECKACL